MRSFPAKCYYGPSITVSNVSDEVHHALRVSAAQPDRSAEAEIQEILKHAVKPERGVKLGSLLASMSRQLQLTDEDFVVPEQVHNQTPIKPVNFK